MKNLIYTILKNNFETEFCYISELPGYIELDFKHEETFETEQIIKVYLRPLTKTVGAVEETSFGYGLRLHSDISDLVESIYTSELEHNLADLIERALKDQFPVIYLYTNEVAVHQRPNSDELSLPIGQMNVVYVDFQNKRKVG